MSKRLNYFQAHENRNPKRIKKNRLKYKSYIFARLALNTAIGLSQVKMIQSQHSGDIRLKKISVFDTVLNIAINTVKTINNEKQIRFNATKRYVKRKS